MKKTIITTGIGIITLGGAINVADRTINDYVEKEAHYELTAVQKLPHEGQSKSVFHKDEPKVTISRWNGEAELSIKYSGIKEEGKRKLLSNDIEWKGKGNKESVRAYPVQIDKKEEKIERKPALAFFDSARADDLELDEGFEFEVIWEEEPDTTVIQFEFEGWENFDFFFQPPLTQEEIDNGAYQPENVVNSFAVYHKTLKNHKLGEMNYSTGKVGHFYRLKAIDANNDEIWIDDVSYSNGILTVTVDEEWLNNATYPVIIDPTFGYTTIGASDQSIENQTSGSKASLTEDGTVTQISAHIRNTLADKATQTAIYQYVSDTDAGSLIKASDTTTTVTDTTTWNNFTISQVLTAGDYFLLGLSDGATGVNSMSYDSNAGNTVVQSPLPYPNWPDPLVESNSTTRRYSIYATYTASGGGDDEVINRQDVFWF